MSSENSKQLARQQFIADVKKLYKKGMSQRAIARALRVTRDKVRYCIEEDLRNVKAPVVYKAPKILVLDIETSPLLAHVWGMWQQDVSLQQLVKEWNILSFSAKWLGAPSTQVFYEDLSKKKDKTDDKELCEKLWTLMDEADYILTHNGIRFDIPRIRSRFVVHDLNPTSTFKNIDTKKICSSNFQFVSNKLEYLTKKFCRKFKKSSHAKFSGFSLWLECMKGNKAAWAEMKDYNKIDVLALEELYVTKLRKWDKTVNTNVFANVRMCDCGNHKFTKHHKPIVGSNCQYERFVCTSCGKEQKGSEI
jgi:hypothetical protein